MFSSSPSINFEGAVCWVITSDSEVEYAMADLIEVTLVAYDGDQTSIKDTDINEMSLVVDLSDPNIIDMRGVQPDAEVSLYDLKGVKVASGIADASGSVKLHVGQLPSNNIYILSTNHVSLKIHKK